MENSPQHADQQKNTAERTASVEPSSFFRKLHKFNLEDAIYRLLSEDDCGNHGVPLNHSTLRVTDGGCEYVFSFLNDSFEIGIGYPHEWHWIYGRESIHRFIWWYLRKWSWCEWFGLRRWIWYKLLHRRCAKYRMQAKEVA